MKTKIFGKGLDKETGLPVTVQRTGYFHNEEADCIEVYYNRIVNYPSKKTSATKERIIIQDMPAQDEVPEATNEKGEVISDAVPAKKADLSYTEALTMTAEEIGQLIDEKYLKPL